MGDVKYETREVGDEWRYGTAVYRIDASGVETEIFHDMMEPEDATLTRDIKPLFTELQQVASALAAANARAERAEVELRVSGAAYGSLQEALAAARRECEAMRKTCDEALRVALESLELWHAEAPEGQCDDCVFVMPMIRKARSALGAPAAAAGEEKA